MNISKQQNKTDGAGSDGRVNCRKHTAHSDGKQGGEDTALCQTQESVQGYILAGGTQIAYPARLWLELGK